MDVNKFAISGILMAPAHHRESEHVLTLLIGARTLHPPLHLEVLEIVVDHPEVSTVQIALSLNVGRKLSALGRIQRRFTPDDPDPLRAMHGVVELVATDSGVAFE